MKKSYSRKFILILLVCWVILNFVVLPLGLNLCEEENKLDVYISVSLLVVITLVVIIDVILYLKKSAIPYYISIPLITMFFVNVFGVIVSYEAGLWIILLFLQYGIPLVIIFLVIAVIIGIFLEKRKCRE